MDRELKSVLLRDLEKKIILLSGPRQVGKTTLARSLFSPYQYFNFDLEEHRIRLQEKSWDRAQPLVIFDELHKKKDWKLWLKGIYDTEGIRPRLLVTGSARLDISKKMGDSLAGRFLSFRLHPLDLREIKNKMPESAWKEEAFFRRLLVCGGFPEPFLEDQEEFWHQRWRRSHLDVILRQDLLDLEVVQSVMGLETLIALLRERVGSTVSYSSLARDLQKDPKTVKRWLEVLENLYILFRVTPYHQNISRSLLKEPKFYFYDNGQVVGNEGSQLENVVACALLKALHQHEDLTGERVGLFFIRNKEKQEVDFLITVQKEVRHLIEVKWKESNLSPHLQKFQAFFPKAKVTQLVGEMSEERTYSSGAEVRRASKWLSLLPLGLKSAS